MGDESVRQDQDNGPQYVLLHDHEEIPVVWPFYNNVEKVCWCFSSQYPDEQDHLYLGKSGRKLPCRHRNVLDSHSYFYYQSF
jgi:hypothetical protein